MNITNGQRERAEALNGNQGGITIKKDSQIFGCLAEIIIEDEFLKRGYNVKRVNDYNHDLKVNGFKVEVKAKNYKYERAGKRSEYFLLPRHNFPQNCDYYLIVYFYENTDSFEILGYISQTKALSLAKEINAGEQLETVGKIPIDSVFISKKHLQKLRK